MGAAGQFLRILGHGREGNEHCCEVGRRVRFWPISACRDGQLSTGSIEKVGHGLLSGKVRV